MINCASVTELGTQETIASFYLSVILLRLEFFSEKFIPNTAELFQEHNICTWHIWRFGLYW